MPGVLPSAGLLGRMPGLLTLRFDQSFFRYRKQLKPKSNFLIYNKNANVELNKVKSIRVIWLKSKWSPKSWIPRQVSSPQMCNSRLKWQKSCVSSPPYLLTHHGGFFHGGGTCVYMCMCPLSSGGEVTHLYVCNNWIEGIHFGHLYPQCHWLM